MCKYPNINIYIYIEEYMSFRSHFPTLPHCMHCLGVRVIKFFFPSSPKFLENKRERFIIVRNFHPSLLFAGKAGASPSRDLNTTQLKE